MKLFLKILSIVIINLLIFSVLFIISECYLYSSFKKRYPEAKRNLNKVEYKNFVIGTFPRAPVGLQYPGRPVIFAGCSYIYGLFLDVQQTPYYKFSELTKRPVYVFALPGKGLQHTLFVLQHKMYDTSIKNPEYFIYVMFNDHIRRMYTPVMFNDSMGYPLYKLDKKTGLFVEKTDYYPVYRKFFTYYYIKNIIFFTFFYKDIKTHEKNVFAYFRTMNNEIKKQYPDIKFVILLYDDYNKFGFDFSKLEKEGFTVIQTKELTGVNLQVPEYQVSKGDTHPTENAWDVVIPALVKRLKMNG